MCDNASELMPYARHRAVLDLSYSSAVVKIMNINEQTPQMCVWCSTKIPSRLHGTAKSWKSPGYPVFPAV